MSYILKSTFMVWFTDPWIFVWNFFVKSGKKIWQNIRSDILFSTMYFENSKTNIKRAML